MIERELSESKTYDNAVLPNFNMVSNRRSLDDTSSSDMNMISNLHWVVVEVSSIGLVRRSITLRQLELSCYTANNLSSSPNDAPFTYKTVSAQRDNDSMTGPSSSQVATDDGSSRYDSLAT